MAEAAATGPPTPPDELRFISPLLQRAHELRLRDPVVAFYCSRYAVELALKKASKSKESQIFLMHLLDGLEQDKKLLAGNEAITNNVVGSAHVENFALKIFLNADNEDRQGQATKKTAKTFLAASIFLEVLKTFGEPDPEIEEKIKYSKWKATDIIKAIREGRKPTIGPPGGDTGVDTGEATSYSSVPQLDNQNLHLTYNPPSNIASNEWHQPQPQQQYASPAIDPGFDNQVLPQMPSSHAPASLPSGVGGYHHQVINADNRLPPSPYSGHYSQIHHANPNEHQQPHPFPTASSPYSNAGQPIPNVAPHENRIAIPTTATAPSMPSPSLDHKTVVAATKHARFVVSALQYDDVKTAVENLRRALELLEPYNK